MVPILASGFHGGPDMAAKPCGLVLEWREDEAFVNNVPDTPKKGRIYQ